MEIVHEARSDQDLAFTHGKTRHRVDGPLLALGAVMVVAVVGPLLTAKVTGSLGSPQNDDWSYGKTALLLARTGHLHLQGWGDMFLLGQIFTTLPFLFLLGQHESTLQLYGAAAAVLVLACTYLLARPCVTRWRSVAIVGAVAIVPGFTLLVSSYMTDLPGMGAALLTMVLAARAIRRRSMLWFSAALLAGLWAFTIRETMLAALAAACVSVLMAPALTRRFRVLAVALTGLVLMVCFALEDLRDSMPAGGVQSVSVSRLHLPVSDIMTVYLTAGLFVLPLTAWATLRLHRRDMTRPARILGWALGLLPAAFLVFRHAPLSRFPHSFLSSNLTLPNYLEPNGAFAGTLLGTSGLIFNPAIWHLLQLLTVLGGVLLTGELTAAPSRPGQLTERMRRWDPALQQSVVFAVLSVAGLVFLCMNHREEYDRYLLIVVPCVGIALLSRVRTITGHRGFPTVAGVSAIVAVLGFTSADLTWSTDARDGAVWTAAQKLVGQGVSPRQINAGLDWDGTYAPEPAGTPRPSPGISREEFFMGIFNGLSDCWIVSMDQISTVPKLVSRESHIQPYGADLGSEPLYVMHRPGCGLGKSKARLRISRTPHFLASR